METNLKMHLETAFRNLLKQSVIISLLFLGHNIGATEYIYDSKGRLKEIRIDDKPYHNPNVTTQVPLPIPSVRSIVYPPPPTRKQKSLFFFWTHLASFYRVQAWYAPGSCRGGT